MQLKEKVGQGEKGQRRDPEEPGKNWLSHHGAGVLFLFVTFEQRCYFSAILRSREPKMPRTWLSKSVLQATKPQVFLVLNKPSNLLAKGRRKDLKNVVCLGPVLQDPVYPMSPSFQEPS